MPVFNVLFIIKIKEYSTLFDERRKYEYEIVTPEKHGVDRSESPNKPLINLNTFN